MRRRLPIPRIGAAQALELIREHGYELQGRELVSPVRIVTRWMGIYGNVKENRGGEAHYHLTTASAEKVRKSTR